MWNEERVQANHRAVLVSGEYAAPHTRQRGERKRKFSTFKAMILGAVATAEILILCAMVLNIDLVSIDFIAAFMITVLLYFGVVSLLTD